MERTKLLVVLCGVPMQAERAHFFNDQPWTEVDQFRAAWVKAKPRLWGVRSMSGWTAELLGQYGAAEALAA